MEVIASKYNVLREGRGISAFSVAEPDESAELGIGLRIVNRELQILEPEVMTR